MSSYSELDDSQQPALLLLQKMGWKYISSKEINIQRQGILSNVLLEGVLEEQLRKINQFKYRGNAYNFSDGNIHAAIYALKNLPDEGLIRTSEKVYDLLTLGKSFEETIHGDRKSFGIRYIDWEHPENNVYHITDEFEVEGLRETRRIDLVLFINGIPFVTIENKRRDKNASIDEAISQHIRNQNKESGVPKLFHFAQILLAVHPNEVKYATTGTSARFWNVWEEQQEVEKIVQEAITHPLPGFNDGIEDRLPTVQDKLLYCLCHRERLLELVHRFILYDANVKKIARYHQYFTVKNTLERIKDFTPEGQRKGGTIWHTQGSGKSLTMVMLAKCLTLDKDIANPRVIIVTDRVDLDNQITKTFAACQKHPVQARSGNHLVELIENDSLEIITTVIDKFDTALNKKEVMNLSPDIFVLVDESHRSQYGVTHGKMKRVLPKACYLGFTGTPLTQREKNTANKFGGFIQPSYPIEKAVKDKSVVPLLYEGRAAKLKVNSELLDRKFNRLAEPLTEYQTMDLKRKFSTITEIYKTQQVVEEIAFDVCKHYCYNWKGKGFKAMLAVPRKETAIRYLHYFDNQLDPGLQLNAKVIISPPDTREDHEEVDEEPDSEVQKWWDKRVVSFAGGPEEYEKNTIAKFNNEDEEVELLIVVGKLLTGFDAPRCTILYIAKPLAEHNLLQAIARVNRLHEGKDFGYIIDYVGVLGELDQALTNYAVLHEFEEKDLVHTIINISAEIGRLPQVHSNLLDVLKEVKNKKDKEELERFLAPKDRRDYFMEKLTAFGRCLQTSLSSDQIYKSLSNEQIQFFREEFKFYHSLKESLQIRYSEKISYKEYEKRVQKLLDTYIGVEEIESLIKPVNIFNEELFKKEVERMTGSVASKADTIAYRMKKVISEKIDRDPAFYKRFSELIDEAIIEFQQKRITEKEYSNRIYGIRADFARGNMDGIPSVLQSKPDARAFFGILKETLINDGYTINHQMAENLAKAGGDIVMIISGLMIRDWKKNEDVQKRMKNDLEDYLLEESKRWQMYLHFETIDTILDDVIRIAKNIY